MSNLSNTSTQPDILRTTRQSPLVPPASRDISQTASAQDGRHMSETAKKGGKYMAETASTQHDRLMPETASAQDGIHMSKTASTLDDRHMSETASTQDGRHLPETAYTENDSHMSQTTSRLDTGRSPSRTDMGTTRNSPSRADMVTTRNSSSCTDMGRARNSPQRTDMGRTRNSSSRADMGTTHSSSSRIDMGRTRNSPSHTDMGTIFNSPSWRPRASPRMNMSHRDRLTLTQYEKWQKYKRFPYKLVIHVALLLVVTWQLVHCAADDAAYFRNARRNWYYFFFPADFDFASRVQYLYTVNDTIASLSHAVNAFEHITDLSVDLLAYRPVKDVVKDMGTTYGPIDHEVHAELPIITIRETVSRFGEASVGDNYDNNNNNIDDTITKINNEKSGDSNNNNNNSKNKNNNNRYNTPCSPCAHLTLSIHPDGPDQWDVGSIQSKLSHISQWVNSSDLGVLDVKKHGHQVVGDLLRRVDSMLLRFDLVGVTMKEKRRNCVVWAVGLQYNFHDRGQISLILDSTVAANCNPVLQFSDLWERSLWVNVLILILAVVYQSLSLRSLFKSARILVKVKKIKRKLEREETNLTNGMPDTSISNRLDRNDMVETRNNYNETNVANAPNSRLDRNDMVQTPNNHNETNDMGYTPNRQSGRALLSGDMALTLNSNADYSPSAGRVRFGSGRPRNRSTGRQSRRNYASNSNDVDEPAPTQEIPKGWCDSLKFFNLWFVSGSVASTLIVAHAFINIWTNSSRSPVQLVHKLCAGLGCGLLWANLVAFVAHNPGYYTVVTTLNRAIPRVLRFMVGVVPMLFGYTIFGLLYFGDKSERFKDFEHSFITLFAVFNGDEVRMTFIDLVPDSPIVAQVYLYSFITMFMYVVINVFVAIVEESFFSTRSQKRSLEQFADVIGLTEKSEDILHEINDNDNDQYGNEEE